MFLYRREQSVVNVGGVRLGGQPGRLPTVLCGTIFYEGHRIVSDENRGLFDREAAEMLTSRQAELSEQTGNPAILHIYARTAEAFRRYLEFSESAWQGPFIIDSADPEVRIAAACLVTEIGYADMAIYNSLSYATDGAELKALGSSELDSAIVLAYSPTDPGVKGSLDLLETGGSCRERGLLAIAREAGISNLLIDPGALPLGSGSGAALRFCVLAKARLGLPVGSGIHNSVSAWPWIRSRNAQTRRCCDAAAAAMQVLTTDFLLYGPIEHAEFIFPVAAMADIMVAEAVQDLGTLPEDGHPLHRLV